MIRTASVVAALAALSAAVPALAGPDWVENGDAGSDISSGQRIVGVGAGNVVISGSLSTGRDAPDLEDVYLLQIVEPTLFSMDMRAAPFDSQIFIFHVKDGQGFGMLANDNADGSTLGSALGSIATDGTAAALVLPGIYAIAITVAGRYPVSETGAIFQFDSPTEVSGPDGPGRQRPLLGWEGSGSGGAYIVTTQATTFYNTPAPGSCAAAVAGLITATRRRRVSRSR